MMKFKILCPTFLLCLFFLNCSFAQEKQTSNPATLELDEQVSTSSSSSVNPKTNKFESKEGNFSIAINTSPHQTLDNSPGKQYVWDFETKIYTIFYRPHPENDRESKSKEISRDMDNGFRTGLLRQGTKLISIKDISYDTYSGKEYHYELPNGYKFIARQYLIDKMGYQIVGGYDNEDDKKEVLEVLDSFKILSNESKTKK